MSRANCLLLLPFLLAISPFGLPSGRAEEIRPTILLAQSTLPKLKEIGRAKDVNLLAPDQGGQALVIPSDEWLKPITGNENDVATVIVGQEAVYGFQGEKPATFSKFSVLIVGQDDHNPAQIEILVADDSPTGVFRSVGKFQLVNAKIVKSPYQELSIPETTAKYVKIKVLQSTYHNDVRLRQLRLLGRSVP